MKTDLKGNTTEPGGGVIDKPGASAPHPPKGFTAPKSRITAANATSQQERDALDVAREVTSSKTYQVDFTPRAPSAATFAAQLTTAKAWTDELAASEEWRDYVRVQRDLAWQSALDTARKLKPEFDLAAKHDPEVGKKYAQTKAFLDVWKKAAARAVETKAANKKSAKKATNPTK